MTSKAELRSESLFQFLYIRSIYVGCRGHKCNKDLVTNLITQMTIFNKDMHTSTLYITDTSILRTPLYCGELYNTTTSIIRTHFNYGHLSILRTPWYIDWLSGQPILGISLWKAWIKSLKNSHAFSECGKSPNRARDAAVCEQWCFLIIEISL